MNYNLRNACKTIKKFVEKYDVFFYYALLIILTLPRSLNGISHFVALLVNILKFISILTTCVLYFIQKPKLSKVSKIFLIYFGYILFITICNREELATVLKIYSLNATAVILFNLVAASKKAIKVIRFLANYFLTLLLVNLIQIIIYRLVGYDTETNFILGMDNRFILYIIPAIICYYYLLVSQPNNRMARHNLSIVCITGVLSLLLCKSISALLVLTLTILCVFIANRTNKLRFNAKLLAGFVIVLSAALVLFRFHYLFEPFITQVLHKNMSLSYRTYIWDVALNLLRHNPINLLFGFGFFDYSLILRIIPNTAAHVSHFHNLLVEIGFAGGLIALFIYIKGILSIASNINRIENNGSRISLTYIFTGILTLLVFDSFEFYPIYYLTILLISRFNSYEAQHDVANTKKYAKMILKNCKDKVAILLATYNGEKYIAEQIDSLVNQTYPNWVLWISDDGSTDNTIKILKQYKKQYPNKIFIIKNTSSHHGTKYNFNNLMQKVRQYPYYTFCDQDDVWDKNKVLYMLAKIKQEEAKSPSQPLLVYCDSHVTNQKMQVTTSSLIHAGKRELPYHRQLRPLLLQCYAPGCATMFNAPLRQEMQNSICLKTEAHDWWTMLVASLTGKIVYLDIPLHYYRQHDDNLFGAHVKNTPKIQMLKKVKNKEQNLDTWRRYQTIVLEQATELQRRHASKANQKDLKDLQRFLNIMDNQNKVKRLLGLMIYQYWPIQKERVLRLVL